VGPAEQTAPQQQLPDGPKPQAIPDAPRPLANLGQVTPGKGEIGESTTAEDGTAVPNKLAGAQKQEPEQEVPPPDTVAPGQGPEYVIHARVNFVEIPFVVKDNKGNLVHGLTWRDVRVYENNLRQSPAIFTTDAFPLSVALVIDQSMTFDNMAKVNDSLVAASEAFTPYDEVAVFTYNHGPKQVTPFSAGQSALVAEGLRRSQTTGREPVDYNTGPLSQNIKINGGADDYLYPNVNSSHGTSQLNTPNVPKELHTLNDAILEAAKALSRTPSGRRRVIYIVSDGKEYGSKAKFNDVVRYLNANKISVSGTLVGDSSLPVIGFLDRVHLPLTMRNNYLYAYTAATGGDLDAEFRRRGIETSFAKLAAEVRTQYMFGYYTHEPFIDGKYRQIEVKVLRPNLTVIAKKGYWPTAEATAPPSVTPAPK
jgi:VWFA-related protein